MATFAGIFSTISGGGAGLVVTPFMLIMGFTPQMALASSKVAHFALNIGAISSFKKRKNVIQWNLVVPLSFIAAIAALIGAKFVFIAKTETLTNSISYVSLLMAIFLLLSKFFKLNKIQIPYKKHLGYLFYLIISILQAAIGSGIGLMLMYILLFFFEVTPLQAVATKRLPGLVLSGLSFIIFSFSGLVNWLLALTLILAYVIGGHIGGQLALKNGSELVKNMLVVVTICLVVKVLVFS